MRRLGFTLLEMLMVVAILGIISAFAVSKIIEIVRIGVVNGGASTTSRMISNARLRALSMRCPVFAQINGPTYVPGVAVLGQPLKQNAVFVVLKGNCNSPNMFFEGDGPGPLADDRVVAEFSLDPRLRIVFPVGVVAAGTLASEAVIMGWRADPTAPKVLMVDAGAGPVPTADPMLDIQFVAVSGGGQSRHTYVPDNSMSYND